jgi:hypothetical protein
MSRNARLQTPSKLFISFLVVSRMVCAQSTQGTIFGTVTDPSGAPVPQAAITVRSVERGVARTTRTDGTGQYVTPDLEVGLYTVSVEAQGFKQAISGPVPVEVKARVRVDTQLQMGQMTEQVTVEATSALVRTGSAEVSNVVGRQELHELPVFSRNIVQLTSLTPGTNAGVNDYAGSISGFELIVNGSQAETNNFILDGVSDNMMFSGTISLVPPIDAVQEFAVQTSQFSAELGRAGGGVVNMALKSGTNQLHGFAYEYFQNSALNARPFDFTNTHPGILPFRKNQFGIGAGGPIIRNKLFWFANYEGLRSHSEALSQNTVPTAAQKTGDFSKTSFAIFDPSMTTMDPTAGQTTRAPFPGNIIPQSRFNAAGAGLLGFYPNPNYVSSVPGVLTNYLVNLPSTQTSNSFNIKGDINITAHDVVSAHVSQRHLNLDSAGFMLDNFTSSHTLENGDNVGITYSKILGPTLINEARAGYNRFLLPCLTDNTQNIIDKYGVPGWFTNPIGYGFPTVNIQNVTSAAPVREVTIGGPVFDPIENTYQFLDTVSWQLGPHALKFGAEYDHVRVDRYQTRSGGGVLTFNGSYTTQVVGQAVQSPRNGVADMLLGYASLLDDQFAFDAVRMRGHRLSGFVQDDWRLSTRLTVNLGLRWDYSSPLNEEQDRLGNFDLSTGTRLLPEGARQAVQAYLGLPGGNLPPGWRYVPLDQVVPHTPFSDFAPRVGLAYALTSKISLRAGYGLFYTSAVINSNNNAGTLGNPFLFDFNVVGTTQTAALVSQGIPSGGFYNVLASSSFGAYYNPINRPDPYSEKFSADVEWSPKNQILVDLGYAGQRGLHFPGIVFLNMPYQDGPSSLTSRLPYPNVGSGGASQSFLPLNYSRYNGFTASVTLKNLFGLHMKSAYTFSKALGFGTGMDQTQTYSWNLRYDYGPLSYDTTNRWVTSFAYQFPQASNRNKIVRSISSGWEMSGIVTLQSGFPFTVNAPGAVNNLGGFGGTGNRPNVVGHPALPSDQRSIYSWFNTAAFQLPAPYTLGNEGKNILRGPGIFQIDLGVQKRFRIREAHSLAFRMEASNLTNHVELGLPNASFGASGFGVIQSLAYNTGPRLFQAVVRYEF